MKEFIDCHCHIFNIVDVPLYATLNGQLNVNSINKLKASLGGAFGLADNIVRRNEDFIRFFERSLPSSIKKFEKHLNNLVKDEESEILITPLIMDFDCIENVEPNDLNFSNLELQTKRLQDTIRELDAKECLKIKIYPFIGFDLRKLILSRDPFSKQFKNYKPHLTNKELNKNLEDFKTLWKKYSTQSELKNGDILGIKLYPPIGFNPYPDNEEIKKIYRKFYQWCVKEDIPITVHCQKGSYSAAKNQDQINKFADPKNWLKLFENESTLQDLRINFAHFGGDDGVEDMIDGFSRKKIDKSSWTYTIIKLLKTYKNTYSDISAYDYGRRGQKKSSSSGVRLDISRAYDFSDNLKRVIEYDYNNIFDQKVKKIINLKISFYGDQMFQW